MEHRAAGARSVWRAFAVGVIALVAAAATLPDVVLPWYPFSGFGMQVDAAGNIIGVDRGRAADVAGLRHGDQVDETKTPITSRRYLDTGYAGVPDGLRADFVIRRGATERTVSLVATPRPRTFADNATDLLLMLADAAVIVICAALVLLRPSRMTWAFFLYGAFDGGSSVLAPTVLPLWGYALYSVVIETFVSLAWVPLALFAVRFPSDTAAGWRGTAQRVLLFALIPLVPFAIWVNAGALFALPPTDLAIDILGLLSVAGFVFVVATFAITYVSSSAIDRARLRWVMLGMLVGEAGLLAFNLLSSIPGLAVALPIPAINILSSLQIAMPIAVAYAVIRHRVFDIRFVIGRAVVYGLLTTTLLVIIAVLDFVIGQVLSETHLATVVEAFAAVSIGLSLNTLHRWLERFVDATLFRSRRRAEQRLQRIARGLVHADSAAGITHVVVAEPYDAYRLSSAALFDRRGEAFVRAEAVGWQEAQLQTIAADASVVLQLRASQRPLAGNDVAWAAHELPAGAGYPAVVLPIFVRGQLDAIVFYGPHASGEDLDPEEIAVLEDLMRAAAAAYDHCEAQVALAKMALLEAEVTSLRGLVIAEA